MTTSSNIRSAIAAAKEAGVKAKKHFGSITPIREKTKGDAVSVVTKLDIEVEDILFDRLTKHDSSIGFKGEEHGLQRKADRFWLVDPIDGTGFYVRGIPLCTTMLALIENEQVIASVLYDFVRDDVYFAEKGKGAFCNNKKLHVSERSLSEAYINMEAQLSRKEEKDIFFKLREKYIIIESAVAGFEFIYVASGRMEGRINMNPYGKDYDFAPGSLLVSEAGGVVVNIGKSTYDYKDVNLIAANPIVYKELTSGRNAALK